MQVRWITPLDEYTRDDCRALNGRLFFATSAELFKIGANHMDCRCAVVVEHDDTPDGIPSTVEEGTKMREAKFSSILANFVRKRNGLAFVTTGSRYQASGIPDVYLCHRYIPCGDCWLELKLNTNKLTSDQRQWLRDLTARGVEAYCLRLVLTPPQFGQVYWQATLLMETADHVDQITVTASHQSEEGATKAAITQWWIAYVDASAHKRVYK